MEMTKNGRPESRPKDGNRGREGSSCAPISNRDGSGRGDDSRARRSFRERERSRSRGRTSASSQQDGRHGDRRGINRSLDRSHRTQRSQERSTLSNRRRHESPPRRNSSPHRRHSPRRGTTSPTRHNSPSRRDSSPTRRNVSPHRRNHSPQRQRSPWGRDKRSPPRPSPRNENLAPRSGDNSALDRLQKSPDPSRGSIPAKLQSTISSFAPTSREADRCASFQDKSSELTHGVVSKTEYPSAQSEAHCRDGQDATGTLDKLTSRYRSADDRHTSAENGASARVEETHNPSRDDISSASKARQSALNEHWQKSSKNDSKECKDGSKRQEASSHGTEKSVKERVRFAEDLVDQPRKSRWSSTVPKDSDEVRKEDRKDKPRLHGVVDGGDLITDTGIEPLAKKQRLKKEEKPARPPRPVYTDPMTEVWAQSWTKVWQKHREANRMETKCLVTKGDVSIASFMVSLAESELALIGQRIQAHEARLQQRERDGIVDDDLTVLPPSPPDDET